MFYGKIALGNGLEIIMGAMRVGNGLFIGIETLGAAYFAPYPLDMLRNVKHILRGGDGQGNMIDFISDQFWRTPHRERQGCYASEHCLAPEEDIDNI